MGLETLISVSDVARALGLTIFGVYSLVHKRQIPAVKISKRCLRFRPSEIEAWLASKSQDVQERRESQKIIRRVRAKGNGIVSGEYINRLVENARKEVLK